MSTEARFQLLKNDKPLWIDTRGPLLDFIEGYYVQRGGYEQVSVNHYALAKGGKVIATVVLKPVKEPQIERAE